MESPIREQGLKALRLLRKSLRDISEELSERQKTAIWHMTDATAFRNLSDMVSKGVIRQYGGGRSVYYALHEANSEANNEANKQETKNRPEL